MVSKLRNNVQIRLATEAVDLTAITGTENTLYQTTYRPQKDTFYQAAKQVNSDSNVLFEYEKNNSAYLYEHSRKSS